MQICDYEIIILKIVVEGNEVYWQVIKGECARARVCAEGEGEGEGGQW